ncbi:MAG: ABC transporter ATP-binding protein, partial [Romboutsia timonensis]|uniref:ABC transporter ATP-binding protein n=1 Tax=Romboutsia timonensis TaxID=1776391 RepID=UPI002A766264
MKSQNKRPKGQNPSKTLKRLMGVILKNYTPHCIVVLLCIFGSAFVSVKGTLFMQTLIDDYILPLTSQSNPDFRPLGMAIMKLALFFVAGALMTYTYNRIMVNVSQGTMKKIRIDVFTHMESLPIKYFDTHAHGDIMSIYTNDIDTLRQMISQSIPQLVNSAATIVSVLISMIILNIPLTILTLIMVAIMVLTTGKVAGKAGSYFIKQQKSIGELNGFIEEMMEGQKVVKVFCHEEESIKDFNKLNEQLFDSANNANAFANILMPINVNLGNLSYVACAILGSILAISGVTSLTLGALASFLQLNKSFSHPISQVSQQLNSIIMALAGAERVFSLLDEEPEVDDGYVTLVNAIEDEEGNIKECEEHTGTWAWKHPHSDGTVTLTKLLGDVTFNDVDFGYNEEKTILHNIKLYAEPGQKVAFVGSTGAGKTTITNLINRFYDIQDGKIKYDGININKIKKADLRRSLGIVLQDTHLFTGTVADNIRYGNLNATDEEVAKA